MVFLAVKVEITIIIIIKKTVFYLFLSLFHSYFVLLKSTLKTTNIKLEEKKTCISYIRVVAVKRCIEKSSGVHFTLNQNMTRMNKNL